MLTVMITEKHLDTHTDTQHDIGAADLRAWQLEGANRAHLDIMGAYGSRKMLAWRGNGSGRRAWALRQLSRYLATFSVTVTSGAAVVVTAAVTVAA